MGTRKGAEWGHVLFREKVRVPFSARPLRQRAFGLGDDRLEGLALVHRDVGEDLAVQLDAGELEPVHEAAVGHPLGAHGGVDPLDPERPERALLHLSVAISVLAGLLDRLAGDPDGVLAAAVIALRLIQQPFVLGAGGHPALDACHVKYLLFQAVGRPELHPRRIGVGEHFGAAVLADVFGIVADQAVALAGDSVLHLAGGGELEALLDPALGLQFGHFRLLVATGADGWEQPRQPLMAGRFGSSRAGKKARIYGRAGAKARPAYPARRRRFQHSLAKCALPPTGGFGAARLRPEFAAKRRADMNRDSTAITAAPDRGRNDVRARSRAIALSAMALTAAIGMSPGPAQAQTPTWSITGAGCVPTGQTAAGTGTFNSAGDVAFPAGRLGEIIVTCPV